jgi:hypothetical protein
MIVVMGYFNLTGLDRVSVIVKWSLPTKGCVCVYMDYSLVKLHSIVGYENVVWMLDGVGVDWNSLVQCSKCWCVGYKLLYCAI